MSLSRRSASAAFSLHKHDGKVPIMMKRTAVLFALVFSLACSAQAQSTPSPALLVLAKNDRTLAIVDPATLKVIARLPSGPDPHEVIASTDGKLAFVSNYGFGAYNTISVIDLQARKALPLIDLGALRGPHGLAFVDGELYFTAEVNKVIGRYNPSTHKIDWILGTGQNRTHMVWVAKNLKSIYTSNVNSATISIIEKVAAQPFGQGGPGGRNGPGMPPGPPPGRLRSRGRPPRPQAADWNETVVPVGRGSEGFDVSPDGKEIWVGNAQDGTISVIDVAAKRVVQTIDANFRGANRLKFTPDGKRVFVSSLGNADVLVYDAGTRQVVKRIKVGRGAAGILMQPDGARAYVSCSPDDYVVVIGLKTLDVTGQIHAGAQPDGLAWAVRQ
jgi:YVTN family beta-propeller protein